MLQVLKQWYERHFSDPQVVLLALLLIFGFALIFFAGHGMVQSCDLKNEACRI